MRRAASTVVSGALCVSLLLMACGLCACAGSPRRARGPAVSRGLVVDEHGVLRKDGAPYRGIGMNYFSAFRRVLADPDDTSFRRGFEDLAGRGIPFVRFMACGFWPQDMQLYHDDKEAYYARMDIVVRAAEETGLGLIPSLFWFDACVPDMMGEPRSAWGDPSSKTREFMRRYTSEVVRRYLDSPAIWAWELGNEYSLAADLPNAAENRPYIVPHWGTPDTRGPLDDMTTDMLLDAFRDFAATVRRYDPVRAVTTGNSLPRPAAHHMRTEGSWTHDTREQFQDNLLLVNPDPMDLVSVHVYPFDARRFGQEDITYEEILTLSMEACRRAGKALFVGEFGAPDDAENGGPERARREILAMIRAIEACEVPLSAFWVYDLAQQEETCNVTPDNARAYVLDELAAANRRIAARRGR